MAEISKKASSESSVNIVDRGVRFLREVKLEAQKITWAARKQVLMSSLMVIFLSLFIGAYLGLLDMIYNFIISLLVK
ncbi:MAG: preprotein translocase subunit SecE [Caldimicrobium sp.]|nr:preprotein translocase subunit SecE [Caldimicrobium sp.]MCX7613419.1 preprotein translocase subunit SecE [Caldimicrobium sp.]MDW8183014.1 preprotein translocase subunit SecE [Caldimicrobium sp.]